MRKILILSILILCVSLAFAAYTLVILSWTPPTTLEDGTPLTDLAGYKMYYGTVSRGTFTHPSTFTYPNVVSVPSTTTQVALTTLTTGTWYFSVTSVRASGLESNYSNEVFKRVENLSPPKPPVMNAPTGGVYL